MWRTCRKAAMVVMTCATSISGTVCTISSTPTVRDRDLSANSGSTWQERRRG